MQKLSRDIEVEHTNTGAIGRFSAMASPCELLIDAYDLALAKALTQQVAEEAWRIECKFSRYRDDNVVYQINHAKGSSIPVDEETAKLLDFATHAYRVSDGCFDLTSGVLRRIWRFDGSDNVPTRSQAKQLLSIIGWSKVVWKNGSLQLLPDMEIDFGGIGKEYAVDRAAAIIHGQTDASYLINFGGDLFASAPPSAAKHWQIGVEKLGGGDSAMVQLRKGGLATSGDANRYLLHKGKRYPHVLNPKTGWPVMTAPSSVTVAANTCVEAGLLATLAMLNGKGAEAFLQMQDTLHWVQR